jgi:hypothetical protein
VLADIRLSGFSGGRRLGQQNMMGERNETHMQDDLANLGERRDCFANIAGQR